MANVVQLNPATVEALLDTTWRMVAAETARTDGLDRKAATLATFASLLASLTATLGGRFTSSVEELWAFGLFCSGLLALVLSVGLAVKALLPGEHLSLGAAYLKQFAMWSEIRKPPEQVRGETMRSLIEVIARERELNDGKAEQIRVAFLLLFAGLVLLAAEAATLSAEGVLR